MTARDVDSLAPVKQSTSALANANVPAEVRRKLTGHADDATHQKYTHLELKPLQAAFAMLPSVFKPN
jgi:hypothetical protein